MCMQQPGGKLSSLCNLNMLKSYIFGLLSCVNIAFTLKIQLRYQFMKLVTELILLALNIN